MGSLSIYKNNEKNKVRIGIYKKIRSVIQESVKRDLEKTREKKLNAIEHSLSKQMIGDSRNHFNFES